MRSTAPSHTSEPVADLALWRFGDTMAVDASKLLGALAGLHVLHEPDWTSAIDDGAAAIGIAMRNLIPGAQGGLGLLDVVMTAVAVHASRGMPAASLVLEHVRRDARLVRKEVGE